MPSSCGDWCNIQRLGEEEGGGGGGMCFSETIVVTQPTKLLYGKRYIYINDSYIQLTLQHCDETLILILHTGFSAKS